LKLTLSLSPPSFPNFASTFHALRLSITMETAQRLIDLASTIVGSSLSDAMHGSSSASGKSKQPKIGARNQVYYAKMDSSCPPALVPMLTTMVNGALKSKNTLIKCAKEDGLFDLPQSSLPPNCPPLNASNPPPELIVVLYEALLGSRRVRGTSPIVLLIKSRKASLQQQLAARRKRGVEHIFAARVKLPRFVRVNLLKTTVEATKKHFQRKLGLKYKSPDRSTNVLQIKPGTFTMDPVLPHLFILPCGTNLHADQLVDDGALVLQDRSSCLTAIALSPPPNSICIDTCASPGNKTLHMASLMGTSGKITAFERDPSRLQTLERRIVEQGADSFVTARGADFMEADLKGEFQDVTHILIDPSCSGSGLAATSKNGASMASEYDNGSLAANSAKVAQLAQAQVDLILHAMTLPELQVVAYSTCSVYREENEDVVLQVLAQQNTFECVQAIPNWPHRGLDGIPEFKEIASFVCRATFEKDTTNGFFVARFERIGNSKKMTAHAKRKFEESDNDEKPEPTGKISKVKGSGGQQDVCKQFDRYGKCKRGKKCRFSHVVPKATTTGNDEVDDLMADWS